MKPGTLCKTVAFKEYPKISWKLRKIIRTKSGKFWLADYSHHDTFVTMTEDQYCIWIAKYAEHWSIVWFVTIGFRAILDPEFEEVKR